MLAFFEKYGPFFIMVSIVGAFVFYSVKKEEKEKQGKDTQKKTEDSQKKEL
jgi:hypothetical protein